MAKRGRKSARPDQGDKIVSERLRTLGRRPLFTVEGMTYSWGDALAWARTRNSRGAASDGSSRAGRPGRAIERAAVIEPSELTAAAARFRYRRRLLSAEELDAWLRRWGLTVDEWGGHLERSLLLERGLGEADPPSDGAEIAEAEFVDAVCSGFLEREALGFAADTALANLTPVEAAGDRTVMIARTLRSRGSSRAPQRSPSRASNGRSRGAGWTGPGWSWTCWRFPTESAAREAALCIRHDGRSIADLAAACQGAVSQLSVYLDDLEPSLQPSLLAAQPGELVGPVEENEGFVLVAVNERKPADRDRSRAAPPCPDVAPRPPGEACDRGKGRVA